MGTKVAISRLEENHVKTFRELERQEMRKIIDKYIQICKRLGVCSVPFVFLKIFPPEIPLQSIYVHTA